jgi:hypothetical protein
MKIGARMKGGGKYEKKGERRKGGRAFVNTVMNLRFP